MDETEDHEDESFWNYAEYVCEHGIDVTQAVRDLEPLTLAVGEVCMSSSRLERTAQYLLIALLGGGLVELLVVGQNFATIVQGMRAVLNVLPATRETDEAGRLIDLAEQLYSKRSQVVHSEWAFEVSSDRQAHVASQFRRFGKKASRDWDSVTMNELVDQLESCSTAMMELTRRMGFHSPGPEPLLPEHD